MLATCRDRRLVCIRFAPESVGSAAFAGGRGCGFAKRSHALCGHWPEDRDAVRVAAGSRTRKWAGAPWTRCAMLFWFGRSTPGVPKPGWLMPPFGLLAAIQTRGRRIL